MSRPLMSRQRATPARQVTRTETTTDYGGRLSSFSLGATFWGQFIPQDPTRETSADGDAYGRQMADFICDYVGTLTPSDGLRIGGQDYSILSLTQTATGAYALKLERLMP